MARFVFPEWTEKFKKWVGLLVLGAPVYLIALVAYGVTPEAIRLGYMPKQPVPYSHALHVGEMGMDCRYCHNTVEQSPHAAIPPAETCMNCHWAVQADAPSLLPVREAYAGESTLKWVRVHDLPDYVYFNHSAHVTRGVGCESCHGRVDQMEEVYQVAPLTMGWCLDCHRDPAEHIRPLDQVTVMGWNPDNRRAEGEKRMQQYNINPPIYCSTCHR
jgi:menaquinone reductase, multiheme cytochrome c subunit